MRKQKKPLRNFKMNEGIRLPKTAILSKLKAKIDGYYKDRVGFTKEEILDAIDERDELTLRLISKRAASLSSGIYSRLL